MTSPDAPEGRSGINREVGELIPDEPSHNPFIFALQVSRKLRDRIGMGAELEESDRLRRLHEFLQILSDWSGENYGDDIEAYERWFGLHRHDWQKYGRDEDDPEAYRI